MKLLFVCNAALQRSPTAAELINESTKHEAKFAGIHPLAEIPITNKSIKWADKIIVMEQNQRDFIENNFSNELENKEIHVLNIPDRFIKNDPELIKILKDKLSDYLI